MSSNPIWTVTDIAKAPRCAHDRGALLAVDSTVPKPVLTRPITLGANGVLHSATKYLNGHSEVVTGAMVFARPGLSTNARNGCGGCHPRFVRSTPLLWGLLTLHLRCAISRLRQRPLPIISQAIRRLWLYPGLVSHPGHAIAARQMQGGFGGMLSMRAKRGEAAALASAGRACGSGSGPRRSVASKAWSSSARALRARAADAPWICSDFSAGLGCVEDLMADSEQSLSVL